MWHGIGSSLVGTAWYMIRSGEVWHDMWNAYVNFMFYGIALGYGPVHMWRSRVSWRSCSHVQDPFTNRGTVTCMYLSRVQLLFTLGSESKLRDCEYIYHCSGIEFLTVTVIVS